MWAGEWWLICDYIWGHSQQKSTLMMVKCLRFFKMPTRVHHLIPGLICMFIFTVDTCSTRVYTNSKLGWSQQGLFFLCNVTFWFIKVVQQICFTADQKIKPVFYPVTIWSLSGFRPLEWSVQKLGAGFKSKLGRMSCKGCTKSSCNWCLIGEINHMHFTIANGNAVPANLSCQCVSSLCILLDDCSEVDCPPLPCPDPIPANPANGICCRTCPTCK